MVEKTLSARIVHGHLRHEESLSEFEGQEVLVTLTVVPGSTTTKNGEQAASFDSPAEKEPEPPPWMAVEADVFAAMPVSSSTVAIREKRSEQGRPCIVLPEEMADE